MKLQEPLQGAIVSGNHYLIHIVLVLAQPCAAHYFRDHICSQDDLSKYDKFFWLSIHIYFIGATLLGKMLHWC